jgi:hypothetical protein
VKIILVILILVFVWLFRWHLDSLIALHLIEINWVSLLWLDRNSLLIRRRVLKGIIRQLLSCLLRRWHTLIYYVGILIYIVRNRSIKYRSHLRLTHKDRLLIMLNLGANHHLLRIVHHHLIFLNHTRINLIFTKTIHVTRHHILLNA